MMKYAITLMTLMHVAQLALAMEATDNIAPAQFTWNELEILKNNQSIKRFKNDTTWEIHPVDAKQLQTAWPYRIQLLSSNTFLSRIEKVNEKTNDAGINATYLINKDTCGYGPYTFQLICTPLDEDHDYELITDDDQEPTVLTSTSTSQLAKSGPREQLSPSSLREKLFPSRTILNWEDSSEIYNLCNQERPLFQFTQQESHKWVVFSPTHDLAAGCDAIHQAKCGNLSLQKVMEHIHQNPLFLNPSLTVFVPIAQSNDRNHWTLLALKRENSESWSARHLDSKSYYSKPYDLTTIKNALKVINCDTTDFKYLGHQGIMNNVDCGYFVIQYINLLLQGIDPQSVSTAAIPIADHFAQFGT